MKLQPLEPDSNGRESETPSPVSLPDWIVTLFAEKLHIEVASVDTDLMETGALDSLSLVELLLHLEQGLGVKISLEDIDMDNFRSVAKIAQFISRTNGTARRNGFPNAA
jgi:acyl carrier protein